jgi:hypothetical protein
MELDYTVLTDQFSKKTLGRSIDRASLAGEGEKYGDARMRSPLADKSILAGGRS